MTEEAELDETEREILELLQRDSRRSFAEIAKAVSLSAPAVKRRVSRLEDQGVIRGYTLELDHAKLGRPLDAFTELRFAGSTSVDAIAAIATEIPEVETVFTIAGDPDALVWIRVRDVAELKRVIDRLRRSGKVTGTKTLMVLSSWSREASASAP